MIKFLRWLSDFLTIIAYEFLGPILVALFTLTIIILLVQLMTWRKL